MSTAIEKHGPTPLETIQARAKQYSASLFVPKQFQGRDGEANCVIAIELAERLGVSPLAVMQQTYVVHGKPAWSSTFLIACINASGRFTQLRYELTEPQEKTISVRGKATKIEDITCVAWCLDRETKERLESPPVSIEMAYQEGWYQKDGSKWQTMPKLMLRYRAATLFARLYAPDITLGMRTEHEVEDIGPVQVTATVIPGNDEPEPTIDITDFLRGLHAAEEQDQIEAITARVKAVWRELTPEQADELRRVKADAEARVRVPQ